MIDWRSVTTDMIRKAQIAESEWGLLTWAFIAAITGVGCLAIIAIGLRIMNDTAQVIAV